MTELGFKPTFLTTVNFIEQLLSSLRALTHLTEETAEAQRNSVLPKVTLLMNGRAREM